jgi:hypothetical protein
MQIQLLKLVCATKKFANLKHKHKTVLGQFIFPREWTLCPISLERFFVIVRSQIDLCMALGSCVMVCQKKAEKALLYNQQDKILYCLLPIHGGLSFWAGYINYNIYTFIQQVIIKPTVNAFSFFPNKGREHFC